MKTDPRFEDVQIKTHTRCSGCAYVIITDSWSHKMKDTGKIYCTTCYHKMRSLD